MIELKDINKSFGEFSLKNINLKINKGEYFVLLGPSGAGKTVILEIIAGLIKQDSGVINGMKNNITGFIYQDYMLFPHLNVFNNISYGLKIKRVNKKIIKTKVNELCKTLNISHLVKRNVKTLSGGEKQRVAIARAMIISPEIYLFDEPTAALDRNARTKTRQLFANLHKQTKATFIHITHDFEEALAVADRIAIVKDGKILQTGTPDNVFNKPKSKEIADFLGYQNVYRGSIKDNIMKIDNLEISVPIEYALSAYVAIRSDDIIISKNKFESSARNSFKGDVVKIIQKTTGVEVILDIGVLLHIDITRKSSDEMNIKPKDQLWATFKVSSLKIFLGGNKNN